MIETIETINLINNMDKKLEVHISEHKFTMDKITGMDKKIDSLVVNITEMNDKNEKKFAGKWVETYATKIVWGVFVSFIGIVVAAAAAIYFVSQVYKK